MYYFVILMPIRTYLPTASEHVPHKKALYLLYNFGRKSCCTFPPHLFCFNQSHIPPQSVTVVYKITSRHAKVMVEHMIRVYEILRKRAVTQSIYPFYVASLNISRIAQSIVFFTLLLIDATF